MKESHYNRLLEIINNKDNKPIHLPVIRNMVNRFEKMFPDDWASTYILIANFYDLQRRVL